MFYRNTNVKHLNIRIVSLAAGLALATAAVIGGSEVLEEKSDSNSASVTPRAERIVPQFGNMADAVFASQGIRPETKFATMADAVEAVYAVETGALDIDVSAYLGLGQPAAGQSFANMADAVFASQSVNPRQEVAAAAITVDTSEFLGLGQPGEGVHSESPQFGTLADADFAGR
jgi:hypothetical protein